MVSDHLERVGRQDVGSHDHQAGRFQGIGSADRIERILQVVGTGCDVDPGRPQRPDSGDAARHRDLVLAAQEEQIGVGEGDHRDAGGRDLVGDLALAVLGLQDQRHAMARGDVMRKARRDDALGKVLQREHRRVERLVGVQIDGQSAFGSERQETIVGRCRIRFQVRAPADDIDAHRDGLAHQRPLVRALWSDRRPGTQRGDLDLDQVAQPIANVDRAPRPTSARRPGSDRRGCG